MSLDTPARSDEAIRVETVVPTLPAMRPQPFRRTRRTFLLTSLAVVLVAIFSPLLRQP